MEAGRLVALRNHALRQTLLFHVAALDEALEALALHFPPPADFTTGQAREALGTRRKFIVPVLEFLAPGATRSGTETSGDWSTQETASVMRRRRSSLVRAGGDWSLVASTVFKTGDTPQGRVVGSIPIHLRQSRPAVAGRLKRTET